MPDGLAISHVLAALAALSSALAAVFGMFLKQVAGRLSDKEREIERLQKQYEAQLKIWQDRCLEAENAIGEIHRQLILRKNGA